MIVLISVTRGSISLFEDKAQALEWLQGIAENETTDTYRFILVEGIPMEVLCTQVPTSDEKPLVSYSVKIKPFKKSLIKHYMHKERK